jgi:hypothetical protein
MDFTSRDSLGLGELLGGLGYRGGKPVADGWVSTARGPAGTQVLVDPDGTGGAAAPVKLAFLEGFRGDLTELQLLG